MTTNRDASSRQGTSRYGLQSWICIGLLIVAVTGLVTLHDQVTVFDFGDPGPDARFFPRLVLWLLTLGALLRLWRYRRTPETAIGDRSGWLRVILVMTLMGVAVATMNVLGFVVTVAATGIFLAWLLGERHWLFNPVLPIAVTMAIAWAGRHMLNLPLP
ncbi:Tripartite tricarboxylate transporter TctB family protein [Kushneria avicenniae]|uniref:Tripartite tricarboxylate transporter TctB family protein n=1 Tax=Kushneria avicenniae TaxID=402385 RepID=A0A1I1G3H5_9GAMM|nr:tripartite tricarboxylate transporter TctB family protein [Kushneria avicenniae]SFC06134.1 Tripartite tricarboxylate transporter TctB family protein [Kushneria avicenniae]